MAGSRIHPSEVERETTTDRFLPHPEAEAAAPRSRRVAIAECEEAKSGISLSSAEEGGLSPGTALLSSEEGVQTSSTPRTPRSPRTPQTPRTPGGSRKVPDTVYQNARVFSTAANMASAIATFSLLALFIVTIAAAVVPRGSKIIKRPSLAIPGNRPMKFLILSDLHYGEGEDQVWGPEQDKNTTRVIESVLKRERPDFVVFLGDLVTGENLVNATNATEYLRQMLAPVVKAGIPFASTYGNHDISQNLPRKRIFRFEKKQPLCKTRRSNPKVMPGVTNYVLKFKSSASGASSPSFQFLFLDSNGITGLVDKSGVPDIDWVTEPQLRLAKKALASGTPTFVFTHIPPPQYRDLNYKFEGCKGLHDEKTIDVQGQDIGLWEVLTSSSNVVGLFSGHDHGSSWCCPTSSPFTACFTRHSGYGGYGDWPRGARVVMIEEKNPLALTTWVTLENGSRTDFFTKTGNSGP